MSEYARSARAHCGINQRNSRKYTLSDYLCSLLQMIVLLTDVYKCSPPSFIGMWARGALLLVRYSISLVGYSVKGVILTRPESLQAVFGSPCPVPYFLTGSSRPVRSHSIRPVPIPRHNRQASLEVRG